MDKERGGHCFSVVQRLTEKLVNNKLFDSIVQNKSLGSALMAKVVEIGRAGYSRIFFMGFACVVLFRPARMLQCGLRGT